MGKRKDLTTKQFKHLTVTKLSDKKRHKVFLWECSCFCGKTTYATTQELTSGHKISCGCVTVNLDLTGLKVNNLTVLGFDRINKIDATHSERLWLCRCDCGKLTSKATALLTKGKVQGCSCHLNLRGSKNHNWTGYEEISGTLWKQIKNCAKVRNLKLSITIEYIWSLYKNQNGKCALSAMNINFNDKTASLDRIDSNKGYIKGNVQWVHKDINKIKSNLKEDYFINLCTKVANCSTSSMAERRPIDS